MKDLNFVGIGGAVNIGLGGNCCFYKDDDKLLVIDMCEGVTEKLKKINTFDNIKDIYIIITHTHFDHVAGLGVFIWYCNFILNIKPKLLYSSNKYLKTIMKLLKLTGVNINLVEFIKDIDFKINKLSIKLQPTSHAPELQCFGIMFSDKEGKYYYSGDTNDIDYIKKLNNNPSIKKIYTETSTETYDVHIKYDDLLKLDKEKLVLMHFNTIELYNRAKKEGFNIAKINQ